MIHYRLAALSGIVLAAGFMAAPAHALTMKECSAKYAAAKDSNQLGGATWNDFRKSECGTDADAATAPEKKSKAAAKAAPAKAVEADDAKGLSMADCSTKYKSAQESGMTLKWNDFRKSECGPGADPVAFTTDGAQEPSAPSIAAPRGVSFPRGISSKFNGETPSKARMHTCLEQYYANKQNNSLGGLRWIQKGGGYYSLCNAKLKS
ncbi:antifreeze protein [Mesorhizobium sp. NBSH29]|uniref:antifreeze protein n=1 Tax=Mesorhizobium sp. NBSH29 TaxID=2654249 RepID=UPI0018964B38|nr:antifreeze protein [Mesorhizobium sp. NBSH29]QPC87278.1 antifreeze protein [Mesorhizobium sp. NBSH29]